MVSEQVNGKERLKVRVQAKEEVLELGRGEGVHEQLDDRSNVLLKYILSPKGMGLQVKEGVEKKAKEEVQDQVEVGHRRWTGCRGR